MELLPVREFADRGTKWLLESPENVLGLLQILDFNLSTKIDSSRLHDEKKTFILDNLRQQESDLVFTAPFRDEEDGTEGEVLIYILVEHQSELDISMGFRMLFYMTQIWDTQRREWERDKVPKSQWNFRPILPVLFYTGKPSWEIPISITDAMKQLPKPLERFVPNYDTLFLNVKATDKEKLTAHQHPFGWLLRIIQQENESLKELIDELELAIPQLDKLPDSEGNQWIRAMHYILLLIYNRREPEEHTKLTDIVQIAVQDRKRQEEVSKMGRTIAQALIEEGMEIGVEKGMEIGVEKGMEIGVEKGIIQTRQEDLIELIQFRFRDIRSEINDKIRSIQDVDRLTALFRRTLSANSIEELSI
ncbi:Rpn family recombination-promoting nuclease/putative transposase [bacterium]|nr:Rpn family recombination-promoting nuclease/putative transposase [bacterium]